MFDTFSSVSCPVARARKLHKFSSASWYRGRNVTFHRSSDCDGFCIFLSRSRDIKMDAKERYKVKKRREERDEDRMVLTSGENSYERVKNDE